MKNELLENAVAGLDEELVESTRDMTKIRKRGAYRRAALLAAAVLMLAGAGLFAHGLLSGIEPEKPSVEPADTAEESKSGPHAGTPGNYSVALAKYPEMPGMEKLVKLQAELKALADSTLDAAEKMRQEEELLKEYAACQKAILAEQDSLRADGVEEAYQKILEAYTERTAEKLFLENRGDNVLFSPASLYLDLCMLAETVKGDARDELLMLTGLKDIGESRKLSDSIFRNLYRTDASGQTIPADSVWLNAGTAFRESAVKELAAWHRADVFSVPMGTAEADAVLKEWISGRTGHLLKDAVEKIETSDIPQVLLVSTLFYSDSWWTRFAKELTAKGTFSSASGNAAEADFMHTASVDGYVRGENYTIAALPMESGGSMVFLLPDEDTSLSELTREGLVASALMKWQDGEERPQADIRWSVPKFEVSADLSMVETLKQLGIQKVFLPGEADFTPLFDSPGDGRCVSSIRQAGCVRIDEDGCEAASYTLVEITDTSYPEAPKQRIEMDLNRPFAFMITGVRGLPLFIGLVNTL